MNMYECLLRAEEQEFLKQNLETIEHVFGILERRKTKEYFYERDAEKRQDKKEVLVSIENVSGAIHRIIAERDATEEG